ncbi:hypothetical protein [Treponema maltophilum]|uniref:hypothetical protein n=1 Tax=Treponema maltophilum TaxID=51160 RepID=UPI003D930ED8
MVNALLLIDPQNDFCSPEGTLFIPGSPRDCAHTASFIRANAAKIDSIHITLDCHPYHHIAHPIFWKDRNGNTPEPFTEITYADYAIGKFRPADKAAETRIEKYLQELEAKGRYNLTLWPPHCLKGSSGMAVEKNVWDAVSEWEHERVFADADYIVKGLNPYTDHYSALQAEVGDPEDPSTLMNFTLINKLKKADRIVIAGEALSHCVANTVQDLSAYIPPSSFVLLRDCTSSVAGFEKVSECFISRMEERGMQCVLSSEFSLS